ncbi:NifB/NifX family molybdenum-iron cluster-binding protein [Faecalispora anaeroviscerum]|uniref:NifB/NifX family molybdenum-iron cluster-binding protein n=1 Tax=Faecalispora anaeroviscerum TaxID=2991836 RepID=UPI0024BAA2CC|nr:NifB/NifX family molybdenum-iron cluster-binding protein [Faecalispora anaeroviscerum]
MILAMPYENGNVFQHFGKSKEFQLYEIGEGKILGSRVVSAGENGHSALADMLGGLGVTVLVCGGIGDGAKQALAQWGIRVLAGAQGPVEQVIEDYLADRLPVVTGATCDHHHEEGHSCHGGDSCCH